MLNGGINTDAVEREVPLKLESSQNKDRDKALSEWNDTVKKYLDDYMPIQRKVS